ncbi:nitronate monooxygenase [Burkholderia cenocepacia]|uniref:NAD(P)H-dependent flavin oxidoreductase n=1 Tax=Burkholderia cenocepacia TaxID=95486 RepID=UPI0004F6D09E|nr:nitronate monooxygenase [Burkholderia cenocepacia]AIO43848.1 nitronate monooxygenase family protein [Burkholderia cepacia]KGC05295.1 nitronate monooxygenase family protein [Burkholderia cepacia]MCG0577988.1 nitronate monooxygenase [Burkholderia cenocepacia]MCW3524446.1 nitronate monooxygenase [Burkholderia cenocepacia]MCW3614668.1 nitronate monooxygenase [Burkholderia cenocepacia]
MRNIDNRFIGNVVTSMCGVQYPIFLAGMAAISGPKLVAAVANAGGMGTLGGLRLPPRTLRQWIRETREMTERPFGVNLVPSFGGPDVFEAQFKVILEERPRLLSLFYAEDYAAEMIPRAKDAGMVVMVQVGSTQLARLAIQRGADIVVAQGSESGGHLNRGTIGLLSLLPSMLEVAQGRPVLAAGGIVNRADVATAMGLGASGVLVGTAFVATEESNAHPLYKQKIVDSTVDDTEYRTGYSFGWKYGTPHRVIPNRDKWNLLRFIGGGARAIDKPRMAQKLSLYAGQGVGKIAAVIPAADRVAELVEGLPRTAVGQESASESPSALVRQLAVASGAAA